MSDTSVHQYEPQLKDIHWVNTKLDFAAAFSTTIYDDDALQLQPFPPLEPPAQIETRVEDPVTEPSVELPEPEHPTVVPSSVEPAKVLEPPPAAEPAPAEPEEPEPPSPPPRPAIRSPGIRRGNNVRQMIARFSPPSSPASSHHTPLSPRSTPPSPGNAAKPSKLPRSPLLPPPRQVAAVSPVVYRRRKPPSAAEASPPPPPPATEEATKSSSSSSGFFGFKFRRARPKKKAAFQSPVELLCRQSLLLDTSSPPSPPSPGDQQAARSCPSSPESIRLPTKANKPGWPSKLFKPSSSK